VTLEEAKQFLGRFKRYESRDHYFGDREIVWVDDDEEEVAGGYFGGGSRSVWINEEHGGGSFEGNEAAELVVQGRSAVIGRNDETGPDYYAGA
jgi:FMN phosphatase YigB (HAD superfamily)